MSARRMFPIAVISRYRLVLRSHQVRDPTGQTRSHQARRPDGEQEVDGVAALGVVLVSTIRIDSARVYTADNLLVTSGL